MNPNVERGLRKAFMRRLVSTPRGREHILSLMVAAEEGDDSGVFDALATRADDDELQKLVRVHQEDERVHAQLYRDCLARSRLAYVTVPDELMIIRGHRAALRRERRAVAAGVRDLRAHRRPCLQGGGHHDDCARPRDRTT